MVHTRTFAALTAASILAFPLVGCDSKEQPSGGTVDKTKDAADKGTGAIGDMVNKGVEGAKDAVTDTVAAAKEKFLSEAQTQFDGFKTRIEGWKSKVGEMGADTKAAAESALAGIDNKVKSVESEITKVKDGKSDTFESIKGDLTKALGELGDAVKSFAEKFKL
jgi:hypothetical protein